MNIEKTPIEGLLIITPKRFGDERGYFCESYNKQTFTKEGIETNFVQDNESFSRYGVIRGLHYQQGEWAQCKLVRVIHGAVYDVAVDLREGSKTYGQWYGVELSADNRKQLYIPRGFAHGFSVLSPEVLFSYKCDNFYHPASEAGLLYSDKTLDIDWRVPINDQIVSEKDLNNPIFAHQFS